MMQAYLRYVRLMSKEDHLNRVDNLLCVRLSRHLGHIAGVMVSSHDGPVIDLAHIGAPDDCTVYVLPNAKTVRASLEACSETMLSLMHKDILVLNLDGILCNMLHEGLCSYAYVSASTYEEIDRLSIMDACRGDAESAVTPLGYSPVVPRERYALYHHSSEDVLSSLGVEYPLVVYTTLIEHSVDPSTTIYIAITEDVVTAIRLT